MVRKATSSNRQKILEAREPFIFNLKPVFRDSRTTNLAVRTKSGSIQTFNPSFRLEQKLSNSVSASLAENIWILTEFISSDITGNIQMVRLPMIPSQSDMMQM